VVVCEQCEVLTALQVVTKDLDSMDNGKKFRFMGRVVAFSGREFARLVARKLRSLALVLEKNSAET
jgi:hypothetical protein